MSTFLNSKNILYHMDNIQVAKILENIADILEIQEVIWKPNAYRNAAKSIELLPEDINEIYKRGELKKIPAVGEAISGKIEEMLKKGKSPYYEKLKKKIKIDVESLKAIPELGPKKIKVLYEKLKIKTVKDLREAIEKKKIRKLTGFGEKTEKILLEGIKIISNKRRFSNSEVAPIVKKFLKMFKALPYVDKIDVAGSFRRKQETVGDLDFLIVSKNPELVMNTFTKIKNVLAIIVKGKTKSSVRIKNGLQIDLRVVPEESYGAALLYFTGNKQHNIELRKLALKKGLRLNEYSLSDIKTGKIVASKTENEIYSKLGLKYIEPEKRLNNGEIKRNLKTKHK
jgi:DNA polymerase (family X)